MAVRLREADNIAAMAELQQQISELEIQVKPQKPPHYICYSSLRSLHHQTHSVLFTLVMIESERWTPVDVIC